MKVGSLCSGIGGLDLALEAYGHELTWTAEIDPDASKVLEKYWPGVPNLGDIKTVLWDTEAAEVDIITAGYPCQPFSLAGRRNGESDARHLWPAVLEAIRINRPRYVFLENVRGHLSLGFKEVLYDLAQAGFDAEWGMFRSSDVGAPHRRERLFVLATNTRSPRRWEESSSSSSYEGTDGEPLRDYLSGRTSQGGYETAEVGLRLLPTPTSRDWKGRNQRNDDSCLPGAVLLPTPTATQGRNATSARKPDAKFNTGTTLCDVPFLLPTPTAWLGRRPSQSEGSIERWNNKERSRELSDCVAAETQAYDYGRYTQAVEAWAQLWGPAPAPTEQGKKGPRLTVELPEWMMGFPKGWVSDFLHLEKPQKMTRTAALRAIGNAVQPQVAMLAWAALNNQRESFGHSKVSH